MPLRTRPLRAIFSFYIAGVASTPNVRAADVVSSVAQLWISVVGRGADRRRAARTSSMAWPAILKPWGVPRGAR